MADETEGAPEQPCAARGGRIDLRDVKRLVHLMDQHGLSELELEDDGRKVRLRKGGIPALQPMHPVAAIPQTLAPQDGAAPAPAPRAPAARGVEIKSPMVGTFYRAQGPEAAPFVEVGDSIRKDSVLCIIEAMKVMNEIKSEIEGEILAVLVQNGEAVEYDQPLLLVRPVGAAAE
jgi:acetyl-CoA carboxylase biotin carboxyl carrier protein